MTSTVQEPVEREEPPFSPAILEDLFKVLDKAVRAIQLYLPNNPTYLKALENARKGFAPLWAETDAVTLTVTETALSWYGVAVHATAEKSGDSIPWLLFKDGLREFTWTPGFEEAELERFIALLPRARRATAQEDDLLTMLWEQDFQCMRYRYVELSDPSQPLVPEGDPGRWPAPEGQQFEPLENAIEEAQEQQPVEATDTAPAARPSGVVRMDDFDSTLYFLDPHEIEYLREETKREYALDLRRLVLSSLLDIFELQVDPLVRAEIANDLEALVLHLLAAGQFSSVAYLLREVQTVMQRARELTPADRERFGKLADRLSHPDALGQMLQSLEEAAAMPPKDDLAQLFAQLKPTVLGVMLDFIDKTQNTELRPLLEASAERLAQSNTGELVRLIKDKKIAVAREAIRRAGALRTAAAVPSLAEVFTSGAERPLRAAAVTALTEIGTPGALSALEAALGDEERDIRIATIRALQARTHRPALAKVDAMVKGKAARDADRTERIAIFELYGTLCGDAGIPFLDGLLNAKGGLFSKKEDPELRACAALALGRIGTAASRTALEKAVGEKEVIVKSAVTRALRGGAA